VDDEHRDRRAVARLVPDLVRHVGGCVEADVGDVVGRQAVGPVVVSIERRGLHVRLEAHPYLVGIPAAADAVDDASAFRTIDRTVCGKR
jgi:hypothetical protein